MPVFSKLRKILMYNRLINPINENQIQYKKQFWFQIGKSTFMALFVLLDKISAALDNGDYVTGVIYFIFLRHLTPWIIISYFKNLISVA